MLCSISCPAHDYRAQCTRAQLALVLKCSRACIPSPGSPQVCQPFDKSKFNFTKAFMREVLLQFEPSSNPSSLGSSSAAFGPSSGSELVEEAAAGPSPTVVLINVSPIEYGHVLLVPRVNDCIPQVRRHFIHGCCFLLLSCHLALQICTFSFLHLPVGLVDRGNGVWNGISE